LSRIRLDQAGLSVLTVLQFDTLVNSVTILIVKKSPRFLIWSWLGYLLIGVEHNRSQPLTLICTRCKGWILLGYFLIGAQHNNSTFYVAFVLLVSIREKNFVSTLKRVYLRVDFLLNFSDWDIIWMNAIKIYFLIIS